jgi:hypothetical protein
MGGAVDQVGAEQRLELPDGAGQGRLGDEQLLGGPAERHLVR